MKIARIYFDQDMRNGFDGFKSVLRKDRIEPSASTDMFIFINRAQTKFKILNNSYLVYFSNGNRKIPLTAFQYLPVSFGGTELDLKASMQKAIYKDFIKNWGVIQ